MPRARPRNRANPLCSRRRATRHSRGRGCRARTRASPRHCWPRPWASCAHSSAPTRSSRSGRDGLVSVSRKARSSVPAQRPRVASDSSRPMPRREPSRELQGPLASPVAQFPEGSPSGHRPAGVTGDAPALCGHAGSRFPTAETKPSRPERDDLVGPECARMRPIGACPMPST